MNQTIKDLLERRSIRAFETRQVSDGDLKTVLEVGTYAPTAANRQSPIMIAVQNADDIAAMSRLNAAVMGRDSDPFYGAPTVIVVFAQKDVFYSIKDASLVMGNLMNAAHAIGLGSCWINRAYEVFEKEEGKALLKKWGIHGSYVGIGNCILGYPAEAPAMKPRKENGVYYVL